MGNVAARSDRSAAGDWSRCHAATARALANRPDLVVEARPARRPERSGDEGGARDAASPGESSWAQQRALADALGLRRRFSDHALHVRLRPPGRLGAQVFDALEQARTEALGLRIFPGCRRNLAVHAPAPAAPADVQLDATVLPERLRSMLVAPMDAGPVDARYAALAAGHGRLERLLCEREARLRAALADQAAYAQVALELVRELGIEDDGTDGAEDGGPGERAHRPAPSTPARAEVPGAAADDATEGAPPASGTAADPMPSTRAEEGGGSASAAMRRQRADSTLRVEGYRAFSTADDEVVAADELFDGATVAGLREQLSVLCEPHKATLSRLANRLQRHLLARQRRWWEFDLDDGLLDSGSLAEVVVHPARPLAFKQERARGFQDTAVTLLIDNSGSMRGRYIALAAVAVELLARAMERCGVKVEVLGFTTRDWNGGASKQAWVRAGAPQSPGRLNALRHIVYKGADEPWRRARRKLGVMLHPEVLKENIDGEALLWAHGRLCARPEQRKILMVISDGAPAEAATVLANGSEFLDRHLQAVTRWIERGSPVELLAIGIGHDVSHHYRQGFRIVDATDLGTTLAERLGELLATDGTRRGRRQ